MLARYQKNSLRLSNTDVCLSPILKTDFIQLVPERKVKVQIMRKGVKATHILVEITGYKYDSFENHFEVKIESEDLPQPLSGVITNSVASRNTRSAESSIREIRFPDKRHFVATGISNCRPNSKKICSM